MKITVYKAEASITKDLVRCMSKPNVYCDKSLCYDSFNLPIVFPH